MHSSTTDDEDSEIQVPQLLSSIVVTKQRQCVGRDIGNTVEEVGAAGEATDSEHETGQEKAHKRAAARETATLQPPPPPPPRWGSETVTPPPLRPYRSRRRHSLPVAAVAGSDSNCADQTTAEPPSPSRASRDSRDSTRGQIVPYKSRRQSLSELPPVEPPRPVSVASSFRPAVYVPPAYANDEGLMLYPLICCSGVCVLAIGLFLFLGL
eukprot:3934041-Rhodomonas_salina.1